MCYEITTLETLQQSLLDFYKTQLPLVPSQRMAAEMGQMEIIRPCPL